MNRAPYDSVNRFSTSRYQADLLLVDFASIQMPLFRSNLSRHTSDRMHTQQQMRPYDPPKALS